jgi:FdhE protein
MSDVFEKRIRRAEFLEKEWPFAAELLRFYRKVWGFQKDVFDHLHSPGDREEIPPAVFMERLRELAAREGPPALARLAGEPLDLRELLVRYTGGEPLEDPLLEFFPRVFVQPAAMSDRPGPSENAESSESPRECPDCGDLPIVSLLREDKSAETVRRSLICSRCSREWAFARVLCPGCGEEKPEKLPRYTAQEIPWMRVDGCDTCRKFLKSVDLTLNWDAEPVVDELAATPLDVIAREHGYTKIAPNLAGL